MGVTGVGKTTVGRLLAAELGWTFIDADEFHPASNVEKMRRGDPLTDADRKPWFEKLRDLIRTFLEERTNAVIACSALKSAYRDYLLIDKQVRLVYLTGDYSLIEERLKARKGHYMNPSLLDSQFATLQEPERAITVDVAASPEGIVRHLREELGI
jgi:gluconokinase